ARPRSPPSRLASRSTSPPQPDRELAPAVTEPIVQAPIGQPLSCVAGSPFPLTLNGSLKDADGNAIAWSDASDWTVVVTDNSGTVLPDLAPTVTSPQT